MTSDLIGNFSKRVLLTGAGWSRNWGGQLASELWQVLMGHEAVQNNERLRTLLLDEPSFELALARTFQPPYSPSDRQDFERALLDAFISMDREISSIGHSSRINIYKVQEFFFRFWGWPNNAGIESGYLFTLNQDLFFERHLYNEHVYGSPALSLPGLKPKPNHRRFAADIGPYTDEFIQEPIPNADQLHLRGLNIIKLHGSFNWRTGDSRNVTVVGTEKTAQIASLPLLAWYMEIFRQVLSAGDVRLMIAGYGFGDEHINSVIAEAVKDHGLRIFIWDIGSNLKGRVFQTPHGAEIWKGLLSTATRSMSEVFPGDRSDTEEFRRIKRDFFD